MMEVVNQLVATFLLNAAWQVSLVAAVAAFCAWTARKTAARQQHRLWVLALALAVVLPLLSLRRLGEHHSGAAGPRLPLPPVCSPLVAVYLLLLACQGVRVAVAWRYARRIRRRACEHAIPEHLRLIASRCCEQLGLADVSILYSPHAAGPITLGARFPAIILPESFFEERSPDLLISAIGHEIGHVKRRDFLLNLVYELLCLPVWMHPAAIWIKHKIRATRELACDELVAERLMDASAYARSLVSIADSLAVSCEPGCTLGLFDADILGERVARLIEPNARAGASRSRLLALGAVLALVTAAFASSIFSAVFAPFGGSLRGTVFDASGAVVPRAMVVLRNLATGEERGLQTGETGEYSVGALETGRYYLEVRKPGFRVYRRELELKSPAHSAAVLHVGEVRETIKVTDELSKIPLN